MNFGTPWKSVETGSALASSTSNRTTQCLSLDRKEAELKLSLLKGTYTICRLSPGGPLPEWVQHAGELISITITRDEVSIVCPSSSVPDGVQCDRGWAVLKLQGPLPLQMTGVLSGLVVPLAEADIPVFVISTFDTDYLLIKRDDLPVARTELERLGHSLCLGQS